MGHSRGPAADAARRNRAFDRNKNLVEEIAPQAQRFQSFATEPSHALELIRQGRAELQAGRFDNARKKALQARQLNVVFGMFEDRPDTLLADIDRCNGAGSISSRGAGGRPERSVRVPSHQDGRLYQ